MYMPLRDNNKIKLYKFKTICIMYSIEMHKGRFKNTDNVNVFIRKNRNWQCPICQCGECLICIFKVR